MINMNLPIQLTDLSNSAISTFHRYSTLPIYPPVYLSIYHIYIYLSIYQSIYHIYLSIYPPYLSIYHIYLSYLSIYPTYLSIYPLCLPYHEYKVRHCWGVHSSSRTWSHHQRDLRNHPGSLYVLIGVSYIQLLWIGCI